MPQLEIDGLQMHYEDQGSGPPLVLVHGLGASTALWKEVEDDLARDFRVVAYDLRGAGRTGAPPGPYTFEQLVDDLLALIEVLELGPVSLVGHSLGGTVALAYAAEYPEHVVATVGLGALAALPEQSREGMRARAQTVESEGMGAVAETVARNGTAPSFHQRPEQLASFVELLAANDPGGYAALCRVVAGIDITNELQRISARVLLLGGDRDPVVTPAARNAMAARIPAARSIEVEDCGHIIPLEQPQVLREHVSSFLQAEDVEDGVSYRRHL